MSDPGTPYSKADREAQRALLQDALADLATSGDPTRAGEVMRALDSYIDSNLPARGPRESPVTDYEHREKVEVHWALWLVIGGAVIATILVAILMSGGWPAGLLIAGIWVLALFALLNT